VSAVAGSAAIDTNILLYAQGAGDERDPRHLRAIECLARLPPGRVQLPLQVLGEFHWVLLRKYRFKADAAAGAVQRWAAIYPTLETTRQAFDVALTLCVDHGLATWDALILAVAAEHRCSVLISEDMQHGFVWRGVCVVNPFAADVHPRLAAVYG
jgi:predicted nucleic acid-binding protein